MLVMGQQNTCKHVNAKKKRSSRYETCTGVSFLVLTPPYWVAGMLTLKEHIDLHVQSALHVISSPA